MHSLGLLGKLRCKTYKASSKLGLLLNTESQLEWETSVATDVYKEAYNSSISRLFFALSR